VSGQLQHTPRWESLGLQWLCLRWLEALPVAYLAPLTNLVVLQLKAITRPPGVHRLFICICNSIAARFLQVCGELQLEDNTRVGAQPPQLGSLGLQTVPALAGGAACCLPGTTDKPGRAATQGHHAATRCVVLPVVFICQVACVYHHASERVMFVLLLLLLLCVCVCFSCC
jgi:hypothetical protein